MKRLTEGQARRCENAEHPRCRCRCGGALHGKGRLSADAPRELFEQLPDDDPHKITDRKLHTQERKRRPKQRSIALPFEL